MQILSVLNILNFLLPLLWLAVILTHWLKKGEVKLKWVKWGILTTILFLAIEAFYNTIITYNVWKNDPISRYLLPPYDSAYLYQYAFFHYWRAGAINLFIGALWAGFIFVLSKYSGGRFADKTDVLLGFFTAFIVGWPKIFIYLFLALGFLIIKSIVGNFVFKDKAPVAITEGLIIGGLIVAGLSQFFIKMAFFDNLKL